MSEQIPPCTIILKLGTSSLVDEDSHQPRLAIMSAVVETVYKLKSQGHRVIIVSSGAVGTGLQRMKMSRAPNISCKQALAAVGQGRLIGTWDNLFGQLNIPVAQILLTLSDVAEKRRYSNAVNTLTELLDLGVVPIVNENDTVSVSEIKFGDNDRLSAITALMVQADYLFLLTDVNCLYTSNPRKDPKARPVEVVSSFASIRSEVTTSLGSSLGTGGMESKLVAAEIASNGGVVTVISSSKQPESVIDIMAYDFENLDRLSNSKIGPIKLRPAHTLFLPSSCPTPPLTDITSLPCYKTTKV